MNLTGNHIERENPSRESDLNLPAGCRIHFIGIGGSSMSGLAEIVLERGFRVSGSDRVESCNTQKLRQKGAKLYIGHDALNVPDDTYLVVYTLAISKDNPEYLKAIEKGIPVMERGHFLGLLTREHDYSICIAGTHGKTTTTSMLAHVMLHANLDPSVHIGGNLPVLGGNVRSSKSPYFVTEACEYHENFLNLSPYAGVILNIEAEHLDYFKDIDDIMYAFKKFIKLIPKEGFAVVCAESKPALFAAEAADCKVYTYGFSDDCDFIAKDIQYKENETRFKVYNNDGILTDLVLKVPGKHNVLNALATCAVCINLGCEKEAVKEGLLNFVSPDRRFQNRGFINGAPIIDDYAHHPTEIKATLDSAKQITKGRVLCVFQPHTYSRAKAFGDDFAEALLDADNLVVTDIYAAREKNPGDINSQMLAEKFLSKGINTKYISDFKEIAEYLKKEVRENDTILLLGAGNVNDIVSFLNE